MSTQCDLKFGPIGAGAFHICVDMQRLFAEDTPWKTPWMGRVLPKVVELAQVDPSRTIFTRFIPLENAGQGLGTWKRYYKRWESMTRERLGSDMIGLMQELAAFVPPAHQLNKFTYSPWYGTDLHAWLHARNAETLIVSGGETEVCVLSTVLGAIDRGYRVVIASDALCSSSDETHEAMLSVYGQRFSQQIEVVPVETIKRNWAG